MTMHEHHHKNTNIPTVTITHENYFGLAISATLHCLLGCGIGEIAGLILATMLELSMMTSMVVAILIGFIAGLALGVLPLLRKGFGLPQAIRLVIVAEGISIVVMETFEALTQTITPGVMNAGITESIFWIGMLLSSVVGFIAAFPINYWMLRKGIRHEH